MKVTIKLKGSQTKTHCSLSSTICPCEKLRVSVGKCSLFRIELDYDFEAHAFKRCDECLQGGNND